MLGELCRGKSGQGLGLGWGAVRNSKVVAGSSEGLQGERAQQNKRQHGPV
jgi:hypothetical protein